MGIRKKPSPADGMEDDLDGGNLSSALLPGLEDAITQFEQVCDRGSIDDVNEKWKTLEMWAQRVKHVTGDLGNRNVLLADDEAKAVTLLAQAEALCSANRVARNAKMGILTTKAQAKKAFGSNGGSKESINGTKIEEPKVSPNGNGVHSNGNGAKLKEKQASTGDSQNGNGVHENGDLNGKIVPVAAPEQVNQSANFPIAMNTNTQDSQQQVPHSPGSNGKHHKNEKPDTVAASTDDVKSTVDSVLKNGVGKTADATIDSLSNVDVKELENAVALVEKIFSTALSERDPADVERMKKIIDTYASSEDNKKRFLIALMKDDNSFELSLGSEKRDLERDISTFGLRVWKEQPKQLSSAEAMAALEEVFDKQLFNFFDESEGVARVEKLFAVLDTYVSIGDYGKLGISARKVDVLKRAERISLRKTLRDLVQKYGKIIDEHRAAVAARKEPSTALTADANALPTDNDRRAADEQVRQHRKAEFLARKKQKEQESIKIDEEVYPITIRTQQDTQSANTADADVRKARRDAFTQRMAEMQNLQKEAAIAENQLIKYEQKDGARESKPSSMALGARKAVNIALNDIAAADQDKDDGFDDQRRENFRKAMEALKRYLQDLQERLRKAEEQARKFRDDLGSVLGENTNLKNQAQRDRNRMDELDQTIASLNERMRQMQNSLQAAMNFNQRSAASSSSTAPSTPAQAAKSVAADTKKSTKSGGVTPASYKGMKAKDVFASTDAHVASHLKLFMGYKEEPAPVPPAPLAPVEAEKKEVKEEKKDEKGKKDDKKTA